MSRPIILEADESPLTEFTLEDRCSPRRLPIAQLMRAAPGPAAVTAFACAHPVELVQDVLSVAHEARRLPHRLAFLCLLAELALVGCDPRNSSVLQHLKNAWLIP